MSQEFEFGEREGKVLGTTGYWMGIVGRIWIFFAALALTLAAVLAFRSSEHVTEAIQMAVQGGVGLLIGVWTVSAARGFREVDSTQGRDVEHVVSAAENLTKIYRLQAILIALFCVLVIVMAGSMMVLLSNPPASP